MFGEIMAYVCSYVPTYSYLAEVVLAVGVFVFGVLHIKSIIKFICCTACGGALLWLGINYLLQYIA